MPHPNQDLILRGYDAFGRGDISTVLSILADDIVIHVPGRSPMAGDHKGHQQVVDWLTKVGQLSGGTFKFDIHDCLATDTHVVALVRISAERGGRSFKTDEVDVWHVANGKATEAWVLTTDPYGGDEFWSS